MNAQTKEEKGPIQLAAENFQPGNDTNDRGIIITDSLDAQKVMAKRLIDGKLISDTFKNINQVIIGIQYAKAIGVEPLIALKMMYVVGGKPSLFGDGPLILIRRSGKLMSFKEYYVDKEFKEITPDNKNLSSPVYAAVVEGQREGESGLQRDFFTVDDKNKAGLGNSPTWRKYERIMLRYRARSLFLKSKFADLLNGIDIVEYNNSDILPEKGEKGEIRTVENLNDKFLGGNND